MYKKAGTLAKAPKKSGNPYAKHNGRHGMRKMPKDGHRSNKGKMNILGSHRRS